MISCRRLWLYDISHHSYLSWNAVPYLYTWRDKHTACNEALWCSVGFQPNDYFFMFQRMYPTDMMWPLDSSPAPTAGEIAQKLLGRFLWNLGTDIHVCLRMNCCNLFLNFSLQPPSGQKYQCITKYLENKWRPHQPQVHCLLSANYKILVC